MTLQTSPTVDSLSSLAVARDNVKLIFENDVHAPAALTYWKGFFRFLALWVAVSAATTGAFYNGWNFLRKDMTLPLENILLSAFCFFTAKPFGDMLALFGNRIFNNYVSIASGVLVSWYPSRMRRIWLVWTLAILGASVPLAVNAINAANGFTWVVKMSSNWALVLSFITAQGFVLGGISAAAMSTDLVDRRRADGQPRMKQLTVPNVVSQTDGILITHMSDLHLTGGCKTLEKRESPDLIFSKLLERHHPSFTNSDAILITGDVTDTGSPEEWLSFLSRYPLDLLKRTILVPGNHDINMAGRSRAQVNDPEHICRSMRLVRMMIAIRLIQGERAFMVDHDGNIRRVSEYLDEKLPDFVDFLYSKHALKPLLDTADMFKDRNLGENIYNRSDKAMKVLAAWSQIFPMAIPLNDAVVLYVFDSNRAAHFILDNALGQLQSAEKRDPFRRLNTLHEGRYSGRAALFAFHHHLVLPLVPKKRRERLIVKGMVLLDAPAVFEQLCTYAPTVVFHGHRHVRYVCSIDGKIEVVSGPSTTLGDEYHHKGPSAYQYRVIADVAKEKPGKKKKNNKKRGVRIVGETHLHLS